MEKGSMYSSRTSGRFTAWAFAAALAFGFSTARAADAPAAAAGAEKTTTQGVVAEKAIDAHGGGDCAKAKEDCPKEAKADCCKKGAKGAKGSARHKHEHERKGAEAKAGEAGSTGKPAAKPAEADKGASHPG